MQADRPAGMPWRMDHASRKTCKPDGLSISQPTVWRRYFGIRNSKPGGLRGHDVELRQVVFIEVNGSAGEAFQLECPAHVINVPVRHEDLFQIQTMLGQTLVNPADIVSGVDDDGFARLLIAYDGAVALERADGKGLKNHSHIYFRRRWSG